MQKNSESPSTQEHLQPDLAQRLEAMTQLAKRMLWEAESLTRDGLEGTTLLTAAMKEFNSARRQLNLPLHSARKIQPLPGLQGGVSG